MLKAIFLFFVAIILGILLIPIVFIFSLIFRVKEIKQYLLTVAIGIDQLGGSVLYAQPDWTVSSYSYYLSLKHPRMKYVVKFIDFFFGKDHCKKSFQWEINVSERHLQEIKHVNSNTQN